MTGSFEAFGKWPLRRGSRLDSGLGAGGTLIALVLATGMLAAGCGNPKTGSVGKASQEKAPQTLQQTAQKPAEAPPPQPTTEKETTPVDEQKAITTPSGLKYIDLVAGTGASPQKGQRVSVHYTGWLKDGKKFDSSVDRGQPFGFILGQGQVIKGWDEGVASMKVGGKRKLIIPPQLGYGPSGYPGVIPPNAELTFDVELLGIQ